MNSFGIVILSRYPQYARAFLSSIQRTHKTLPPVVVVCDRHKEKFDYPNIHTCYSDDTDFIFARNANFGISRNPDRNVILCNDDLTCVQDEFFYRLADEAAKYSQCGILSPLIDGGVGNPLQRSRLCREWSMIKTDTIAIRGTDYDSIPVCFPCVWMSRKMIDQIGGLDEGIKDCYGGEDNDYCIRARHAGWKTMITRSLTIKHGSGGPWLDRGQNFSLSFAKEPPKQTPLDYLKKKYAPDLP